MPEADGTERCGGAVPWSLENATRLARAASFEDGPPTAPPCNETADGGGGGAPVQLAPGGVDGLGAVLTRTVALALAASAFGRAATCATPLAAHLALSSVALPLGGDRSASLLYCHRMRGAPSPDDGAAAAAAAGAADAASAAARATLRRRASDPVAAYSNDELAAWWAGMRCFEVSNGVSHKVWLS